MVAVSGSPDLPLKVLLALQLGDSCFLAGLNLQVRRGPLLQLKVLLILELFLQLLMLLLLLGELFLRLLQLLVLLIGLSL